jgi:hypothetical protein
MKTYDPPHLTNHLIDRTKMHFHYIRRRRSPDGIAGGLILIYSAS